MWGFDIEEIGRVIRERESGSGKRSIIRIGKVGENFVIYFCVNVDIYRYFGRFGIGMVFGSKNFKVMMIMGEEDLLIVNFKEYFKIYQEIYKKVIQIDVMAKYYEFGIFMNIKVLNSISFFLIKNLFQFIFEYVDDILGEIFVEKNLVRKVLCVGCFIGCIYIGQFRCEFDKGYEYEFIFVLYDYEFIYVFGSFLGIKIIDEVLQIIEEVEFVGFDVIIIGVVLVWVIEVFKKGFILREDIFVDFEFGNIMEYVKVIDNIVERVNEFYYIIGKGLKEVVKKYGGEEFVFLYGGNEMVGYYIGYVFVFG